MIRHLMRLYFLQHRPSRTYSHRHSQNARWNPRISTATLSKTPIGLRIRRRVNRMPTSPGRRSTSPSPSSKPSAVPRLAARMTNCQEKTPPIGFRISRRISQILTSPGHRSTSTSSSSKPSGAPPRTTNCHERAPRLVI